MSSLQQLPVAYSQRRLLCRISGLNMEIQGMVLSICKRCKADQRCVGRSRFGAGPDGYFTEFGSLQVIQEKLYHITVLGRLLQEVNSLNTPYIRQIKVFICSPAFCIGSWYQQLGTIQIKSRNAIRFVIVTGGQFSVVQLNACCTGDRFDTGAALICVAGQEVENTFIFQRIAYSRINGPG